MLRFLIKHPLWLFLIFLSHFRLSFIGWRNHWYSNLSSFHEKLHYIKKILKFMNNLGNNVHICFLGFHQDWYSPLRGLYTSLGSHYEGTMSHIYRLYLSFISHFPLSNTSLCGPSPRVYISFVSFLSHYSSFPFPLFGGLIQNNIFPPSPWVHLLLWTDLGIATLLSLSSFLTSYPLTFVFACPQPWLSKGYGLSDPDLHQYLGWIQ